MSEPIQAVGAPLERHVRPLIGCDELREWLIAQGFRIAHDSLSREGNGCNWYAYRRSTIPARECECNDGKPMQIVVRPWRIEHRDAPGGAWESAEVDVTGEAGSHWYKLECYSLKPNELMGRLHEIEAALIAAWNALRPNPRAVRLRCWWFGHEQHPQDSAPPDEATCMHCGEYVPYSDMVGDTRHRRAIDSLHRVWWHLFGRWLPHKCPACGARGKCKPDCDGIPF